MNKRLSISASIFILLVLVVCIGRVSANPLPSPLVSVQSPQNNQVYPSDTVQLSFTPATENCTSFSYVLDDKPDMTTDGNTILTNLPPGSHKLTIYANYTRAAMGYYQEANNQLASIVYFSTIYSTAWVTVAAITLATATIILIPLFFKRRQIAARLKGEKRGVFWFGTTLLVLGVIAIVPFSWHAANDYLFPYWPKGISDPPTLYLMFSFACVIFMRLVWL